MKLVLFLLAGLLLAGCDQAANWAYETGVAAEKWRAGLVDRSLSTPDGIHWHLLESEDSKTRPVVMLVHGFGASAKNWVRFANELEGAYRFIIPDLPGHGLSSHSLKLDYSIDRQAERLLQLADQLGIRRFHLAGSSMGGAISLAMALQAPHRVLSLGLLDAAGVTMLTPDFAALLENGHNPLIPHQPDDMRLTMSWAMANPPWLPDFFVEQMGRRKAAKAAVAEKVDADIADDLDMRQRLSAIQSPTLIIWGAEDRLLSVDNVAVFDAEIPDSRAVVLEGIGHLPMVEATSRTAELLDAFWRETEAQQ